MAEASAAPPQPYLPLACWQHLCYTSDEAIHSLPPSKKFLKSITEQCPNHLKASMYEKRPCRKCPNHPKASTCEKRHLSQMSQVRKGLQRWQPLSGNGEGGPRCVAPTTILPTPVIGRRLLYSRPCNSPGDIELICASANKNVR